MSPKLMGPFQLSAWRVDPALDTVSRDGETLKLEPRMMRLLLCLAEAPGSVVSQERLLAEVWSGVVVSPASVYQAVSQLRRLLGDVNSEPTYIATVPRKGYRLVATVQPLSPPDSMPPPRSGTDGATPEHSQAAVPATATARAGRSGAGHGRWLWVGLALIVGIAAASWPILRSNRAVPATPQVDSIVVLPFVDNSEGKADQPFCDGLTEELSNWLAQIPNLRVVARTSAFSFRGISEDVRAIGHTLGVTHVLEGSSRRSGDHMRIGIELIDARTGFHLWSSEYDRPLEDTIRIQEDVARSVADSLELKLTEDTAQRFAARRSDNPEAYRLYLLARHSQQSRTPESNSDAIELYRRSLSLDPTFALAHVGLAYATLNEIHLNDRPVSEVAAAAEPLLSRAEQLDPDLPELYAVRAGLREELGQTDDALKDLKHAVDLNPNGSWAFAELGRLYSAEAKPREALRALQQALALDPLDYVLHARQCVVLQDLARFAQAAAACERARSLQGDENWAAVVSEWLARSQGDLVQSLVWSQRVLRADPDNITAYERLGDVLLILGRAAEARAVYERARDVTHEVERVELGLARVDYFEQGADGLRRDLARAQLERSVHSRTLIDAAYLHLLLGDAPSARDLMERAMSAPDFEANRLNSPWSARWGQSDLLILATAEQLSGDRTHASAHLQQIADMINQLMAAGEERGGLYALKADVLALQGNDAEALRALARAVDLGWRGSWLAQREPYLSSLWRQSSFQALMTRVDEIIRRARAEAPAAS